MKKVSEIAEELNVSTTAVYNKIKKNKEELEEHIGKKNNAKALDEEGFEILANKFQTSSESSNQTSNEDLVEILQEQITSLKEDKKYLQEQINLKDQQIMELNRRLEDMFAAGLKQTVKQVENNRVLEGETVSKEKTSKIQEGLEKVKNFFQRE